MYPSFEVSAAAAADLTRRRSTIPRLAPISPCVRELARSAAVRVWLPALAAAGGGAALDRRADAGDLSYFVHRGEQLLSPRWASVYGDRELQAGPLQLLVAGAAHRTEVLAFVVELGVVALLLFVLGRLGIGLRWRLLAALAAMGTGLAHGAFIEGHPAEALTPLVWVLAALESRRGRPVRAGALIGLSAGLELWGLLGAAVLFLAPRTRDAVRGTATAAAVLAAQLAPVVLFGTFRMFDYEWRVARGTPLSLVVAAGTHFGWPLRLLQAGIACGLGAVVARHFHRSLHAVWLVPLAVALARILLDPLRYGWYWLEVEALVLVGAALIADRHAHLVPGLRKRQPGTDSARNRTHDHLTAQTHKVIG